MAFTLQSGMYRGLRLHSDQAGMSTDMRTVRPGYPEQRIVLAFGTGFGTVLLLTGCNKRCLMTPRLRLWDAAEWVTRAASSEFGRAFSSFLLTGHFSCFLQVRAIGQVKRIKARGEEPG